MRRVSAPVVVACFLAGCVIVLGLALADRMDDTVHLRAAATSQDRLPTEFASYVAGLHDRTPPTSPPTTEPRKTRRGYIAVAGSHQGLPCGGTLPPCSVLRCENPAGDPRAENPTSTASGIWQVLVGTWGGFGGYPEAKDAPVDVQNEHARLLWDGGRGASHWRSCL